MTPALVIGLKLAYIFILHFIADWALQSKEMSRNKSLKVKVLLQHASIHLVVFAIGLLFITSPQIAAAFSLANAAVHALVDWYLWRGYKLSVLLRRGSIIPEEKWNEWGISPDNWIRKGSVRLDSFIMNIILGFTSELNALLKFPEGQKVMDYLQKEFKYWDDYIFGFMLGFDQMLHAISLVIIFALLLL